MFTPLTDKILINKTNNYTQQHITQTRGLPLFPHTPTLPRSVASLALSLKMATFAYVLTTKKKRSGDKNYLATFLTPFEVQIKIMFR